MNYRHAYHAGNFADVLKHIVLVRVIEYLKRKPTPFRVLDAHGGLGLYDLSANEAARTGEWRAGIGRLWEARQDLPEGVTALLEPYLALIAELNGGADALRWYPGSPLIATSLLRTSDTLAVNELHPEDSNALETVLRLRGVASVSKRDAYQFLKASLPPPEKRGAVLIDPAYEAPDERRRLVGGLADAVGRFATGTYLIWYPVKDAKPAEKIVRDASEVSKRYCQKPALDMRLTLRAPRNAETLTGCGLVILNPPHTLASEMLLIMHSLDQLFSSERGHGFTVAPLGESGP